MSTINEIKRCLVIFSNAVNQGGAETFIMKMYRNIDRSKYQVDFCVMSSGKGIYDEEIYSLGGKIYHATPKSKDPKAAFREIKDIVQKNSYKSVIRINEHSLAVIDLLAAKAGGAERLIMRSSNANSGTFSRKLLHYMFRFLPVMVPNVRIAPSKEAAEYTFGKRLVRKGRVHKLNNGIDLNEYSYNEKSREKKRAELGLNDEFVIVHVGRFFKQKNHKFLVDVFEKLSGINVKLVLIGATDYLYEDVKHQVSEKGLDDKVMFLGSRSDVPELLSAMDMLLFPSLYEGMPNVVIEAQAAGLPCVVSDTITREADITGLVDYLPLSEGADHWAEHCKRIIQKKEERKNTIDQFIKNKYDIESVTKEFVKLVFEEL